MNLKSEWIRFKAWMTQFLMRFLLDTRASVDTKDRLVDWVGLVVSLIFGVYLLPVVVDTIANTNYTNWTFTGAAGAKVLYGLLPFVFIIGMIVYFVGRLLGKI
jgi:hypothetical protein